MDKIHLLLDIEAYKKQIDRLSKENLYLRKVVANSDLPCLYCQLAKADMAKCRSGFPGCGRLDDMGVEV